MFDTLKFARRLKDSGVSDAQAEAQASAIQEAFAEALETQVATKGDIQDIKVSITELKIRVEARMTLIQWMLGVVIAAQVLPLLRSVGVL